MKRAVIVYRSRTGTTRRLAEEIGAYLATRDIDPQVVSVGECDVQALRDVDYLLLGCWTGGLMIVAQHPDQPWVDFARAIPAITGPRIGLFTTYKLATGSMFAQMRRHLAGRLSAPVLELKSRTGRLSESNRRALERFIAGA
jgi:flavodoxin